ncbi:hypothetical protein [Microlunatus soli]|uniref:DUF1453 domain-containing protein n=1 Tax=Microlunatus soli TaxID=630515 RepID=A0A1H1PBQ5_9ACTN|nr:hypothetical protein [Microlunatus soli]SDS08593.1 hypothetical protein SAMN04489812_0838 [Microlunatus soli]
MSPTLVLYVVVGLALLLFISFRQMQWQSVNAAKMMRMPLILVGVGLFVAVKTFDTPGSLHIQGGDLLLIGIGACLALLGGWVMGRLTQIGTVNDATHSRLRPSGLAIWFGFLAVRIGIDVLAHSLHFELAASTPVILFMVAIVKAAQALTVRERVERHELAAARDGSLQRV